MFICQYANTCIDSIDLSTKCSFHRVCSCEFSCAQQQNFNFNMDEEVIAFDDDIIVYTTHFNYSYH